MTRITRIWAGQPAGVGYPYHCREKSSFFARIFRTRRLPVIRVYPCPSVVNPFGYGFAALGNPWLFGLDYGSESDNSETDSSLDFAKDCGSISPEPHEALTAASREIGRMLGSMIKNPGSFLISDR